MTAHFSSPAYKVYSISAISLALLLLVLASRRHSQTETDPEIVGQTVPLSFPNPRQTRSEDQGSLLIYFFNTSCPACIAEKQHIGSLLEDSRLPVISVSSEAPATISEYWSKSGFTLPRPISVRSDEIFDLKILRVPTLLVVQDHIVKQAFVGSLRSLSYRELAK